MYAIRSYYDGKAAPLVLAGDSHKFGLVPVTHAALGKAEAVLGHFGNPAGNRRVSLEYFRGGIGGAYPVIRLIGNRRGPLGLV